MGVLSSPTAGKLLTNVRNYLGQPNASNSRWSDYELMEYINEGVRMYFAEVVLNMEGQFTTMSDLNIVSGTETVDLPSDCYEVKALYKKLSDGYQVLPYQNAILQSYSTSGIGSGDTFFPSYYFRDNKIVLRPIPDFSETSGLRIEYVRFPETLINGGDTLTSSVSPVFKQLIEMYAVYKAKVQESLVNGVNLAAVASDNLSQIYSLFKTSISSRSKYPQYTIAWNPEGEGL